MKEEQKNSKKRETQWGSEEQKAFNRLAILQRAVAQARMEFEAEDQNWAMFKEALKEATENQGPADNIPDKNSLTKGVSKSGEPKVISQDGDVVTKEYKGETYKVSGEKDEQGHPFVLNSNGEVDFGTMPKIGGQASAPVCLSEGNSGYGFIHIEDGHGKDIRNANFRSVPDFITYVIKNVEVIKKGKVYGAIQSYQLQAPIPQKEGEKLKNSMLMVELSKNGKYYNINTAGIFKESYGDKNEVVYDKHALANQDASPDAGLRFAELNKGTSYTSMNSATTTSGDKGNKEK